MDYHADRSQYTFPQHDTYPPQNTYISRSLSQKSSTSSFVKKPPLASEESLPDPPPLKATVEKQSEPTRKWYQILFPSSWPIRLFLATVVLETIIDLAIQGDIYSRIQPLAERDQGSDRKNQKLVMYLSLFAFAHVFQLCLAIEAVWSRNSLQFLFLTIFNFTFFVYSIIEATEIRHLDEDLHAGFTSISVTTLTIFSHIVLGVAELAYVGLGYQIWKEFGWKVYKFLGADIQIKRIFAHYQIFLSLLRFDMFFAIGFSAQLIFLVLDKADAEYYLTIGALPLGVLILVGGHFAARYENKWLMFSFMLGCVCATVYFSFKLFRIYEGLNTTFVNVYKSMTAFAGLSLFFLILTFIWGCIVMHNFGRGLKEQMSKKQPPSHRRRGTSVALDKHFQMTTVRNRMSIE